MLNNVGSLNDFESSPFVVGKYPEVDEIQKNYDIDYILLIGWMRIISTKFIENWKNKILNIHPSLLPA